MAESFDDELEQARQELDALDAEAEAAPAVAAPAAERSRMPPWLKIGLVLGGLAGVLVFLLLNTDAGSALAYSTKVDQVVDAPTEFRGRELRVEGELKQGSIRFREEPCEWQFVLQKDGREMPVSFPQCVVPDTFRDGFGISVTVQGQLAEGTSFVANQVIPRCPSKENMKERLENGEEMPHAPVGQST